MLHALVMRWIAPGGRTVGSAVGVQLSRNRRRRLGQIHEILLPALLITHNPRTNDALTASFSVDLVLLIVYDKKASIR